MRPCDSVTGTRWTRWGPPSCSRRCQASSPLTTKVTSLSPSRSDGLEESDLDLPPLACGVARCTSRRGPWRRGWPPRRPRRPGSPRSRCARRWGRAGPAGAAAPPRDRPRPPRPRSTSAWASSRSSRRSPRRASRGPPRGRRGPSTQLAPGLDDPVELLVAPRHVAQPASDRPEVCRIVELARGRPRTRISRRQASDRRRPATDRRPCADRPCRSARSAGDQRVERFFACRSRRSGAGSARPGHRSRPASACR